MNTVRAKFRVVGVTDFGAGRSKKVELQAVYDQHPDTEDHAFWKATPNGSLTLYVDNPEAAEMFKPDDRFYLDFHKAE